MHNVVGPTVVAMATKGNEIWARRGDPVAYRLVISISDCDCDLVSFGARLAVLHGCMLSPLGRSALHCSLRYKFDIRCLLNLKFNHCSVIWHHCESSVSSELLAKVAVLRDMLLFRDNPNLCTGLFDTDEIAAAIKCICTE